MPVSGWVSQLKQDRAVSSELSRWWHAMADMMGGKQHICDPGSNGSGDGRYLDVPITASMWSSRRSFDLKGSGLLRPLPAAQFGGDRLFSNTRTGKKLDREALWERSVWVMRPGGSVRDGPSYVAVPSPMLSGPLHILVPAYY
jgi:hypothetical protein